MAEKPKKVNYAYVKRRLTITAGLPAEVLLYLGVSLLFLFMGFFMTFCVIFFGGSALATVAMKRGCNTITFAKDFIKGIFSDNIHTIRSEAKPKRPVFPKK